MSTCRATFEPPKRVDRTDTHTCDLPLGHGVTHPHHCPTCGALWQPRIGAVAPERRVRGAWLHQWVDPGGVA